MKNLKITEKEKSVHFVIIVTWNPAIKQLREIIDRAISDGCAVLVYDNGSKNAEELEEIRELTHTLVLGEKNIGLAEAQNFLFRLLPENEEILITLCDQDTLFPKRYFQEIKVEYIRTCENISRNNLILGPMVVDEKSGRKLVNAKYFGPFITNAKLDNKGYYDCDFIIASGMTFNGETLSIIGENDSKLFIGYIDVEFCIRAKALHDIKSLITSRLEIEQNIGIRMVKIFNRLVPFHSPIRRYYMSRNSIYLIKSKHMPVGFKIREIAMILVRTLFDVVVSRGSLAAARQSLRGIKDGIAL